MGGNSTLVTLCLLYDDQRRTRVNTGRRGTRGSGWDRLVGPCAAGERECSRRRGLCLWSPWVAHRLIPPLRSGKSEIPADLVTNHPQVSPPRTRKGSSPMHRSAVIAPAAVAVLALTACGAPSENEADSTGGEDTLVVGATAVPAGEILEFVDEELAAEAGLSLEIQEFSDYIAPNTALAEGQLDANLYQHEPYLLDFNEGNDTDLTAVQQAYLPPLGLYSEQVDSVEDLEDGAEVALPNDPTNEFRALVLLEESGLITLADGVDENDFSLSDIEDNPKDLDFLEVEAPQLPRSLSDVDAAIVNNNYAQEAGLDFEEDSILMEEVEGNDYVNVLAARTENADDPRIATLGDLLLADETLEFIEEKYQGSIIPAEGD